MTLEELKKEKNPWINLHEPNSRGVYMPIFDEQGKEERWYCANVDRDTIKYFLPQDKEYPNMSYPFFNLDPQPWIGKWNVDDPNELPKVIILSFNPCIGSSNFIDLECESCGKAQGKGEKYYELMKKVYQGEASTSELVLSPLWQRYNGTYWLEKLHAVCKSVCNIEKAELFSQKNDSAELKNVLDKIMIIDLCPYHSLRKKPFISLFNENGSSKLESMNFTKNLVEMLLYYNRKIIVARSVSEWTKFVKKLEGNNNCYGLSSTQRISITENNCCTLDKKTKDGIYKQIIESLES